MAKNDVTFGSIYIDEILNSRRYKGYKYIISMEKQKIYPGAEIVSNVMALLTD